MTVDYLKLAMASKHQGLGYVLLLSFDMATKVRQQLM